MTEQQFLTHNSTFKMQIQNSMNANNPRQSTKWDKFYKTTTKWTYSITTLKLQYFSIWRRAWEQEWLDVLQVVSLTDVKRISQHEISQSPQGISHSGVGSFALQPMGRQPALLLFGQPYIFSTSWSHISETCSMWTCFFSAVKYPCEVYNYNFSVIKKVACKSCLWLLSMYQQTTDVMSFCSIHFNLYWL